MYVCMYLYATKSNCSKLLGEKCWHTFSKRVLNFVFNFSLCSILNFLMVVYGIKIFHVLLTNFY